MNYKIKTCINQLSDYFNSIVVNPPATDESINKLNEYFPHLHDDIVEFYSFCDGFNLNLQDDYELGIIISLDNLYEMIKESRTGENPLFTILFPLRNNGFWNFDCILMNDSIGNGSIVFWDNETSPKPDYLLASSLERYFSFLTEDLIERYEPNGEIKFEYDITNSDSKDFPWPFDDNWIGKRDSNFIRLQKNEEYMKLFYNRNLEN